MPAKAKKPTKRANGEGSIKQRPNGTWMLQMPPVPHPDPEKRKEGKTHRPTFTFDTKQEAEEARIAKLADRNKGIIVISDKRTVAEYLRDWLHSPSVKNTIEDSTWCGYEREIRLHINPSIGKVALTKLTEDHIELMQAQICAHWSKRTGQLSHIVLSMALDRAVQRGYIVKNPTDFVDAPRPDTPEMRPLTEAEMERFLGTTAGTHLHAFFVTALATGMRAGELFGLKWDCVDFAAKVIRVTRQVQRVTGLGMVFSEPKTDKSRRSIAVATNVLDALKAHRDQQAFARAKVGEKWVEMNLVFPNAHGKPYERPNFQTREFKPLLTAAGLPADAIRLHDLRHTHATLLFAKNVHPKVVQERLGHATIAITLDTYSHWIPSMGADAANAIDGLFAAAI